MNAYTKADVYRHAAEVIVRDGKCEGDLVENEGMIAHGLADPMFRVCALGACLRAEYELNGNRWPYGDIIGWAYDEYAFVVREGEFKGWKIHSISDCCDTSAEDIAILLKQYAEDIES